MKTVFIQSNRKQRIGAVLAKFAIEEQLGPGSQVRVEIMPVEEMTVFKKFAGKSYLRKGRVVRYDPDDLQSFTLTRFMPPELVGFSETSIVIDPDIFALADVNDLFEKNRNGKAILACPKKEAWDTSVMVLDNSRLTHWRIEEILERLSNHSLDYDDLMRLTKESSVGPLERIWNSLDVLTPETKMLHTTNRVTQPWKTGLPRDFTINPLPKIFGIIPREPIQRLLGKYPEHYEPHPDPNIEYFFFALLGRAVSAGVITREELVREAAVKHLRRDILDLLPQ